MTKRIVQFFLCLILTLSLSACNLQFVESSQGADADNLELTAIVQQMLIDQAAQQGNIVEITATPGAGNVPATEEAVVPAAVLPPVTGDVTVTVTTATNCRTGPGQNFKIIYGMPVGQVAKVIAKNSYSGYWIIEIPGQAGQNCWLWGQYAVINGDTAALKEVVTPTSPAPTITNTPKPTNTVQPTATSTTAAAVAPNAPQILTSFVTCSDAGGGNRNYVIELNWADNSNNETMFVITTSSNRLDSKGPNATSHTFTEVLPAGTNLTVSLIAQNGTGSSAPVSTSLSCP
ncbi:MAG: SH3 domain-containing protein [Anaerolineales bacterium]|nr:SH3 domain-containing protein [Anaerolineales bacterium]